MGSCKTIKFPKEIYALLEKVTASMGCLYMQGQMLLLGPTNNKKKRINNV